MLEFRAAAFWIDLVRGLSAITCPWRLHLKFSCQVESNGWFSAIKLNARISGPGYSAAVACSPQAVTRTGAPPLEPDAHSAEASQQSVLIPFKTPG